MSNKILITGGAGYVGSHVLKALVDAKATDVVVLDNLSTGFSENVIDAKLIQGDILDFPLVSNILKTQKIQTVMHFAAKTVIPESIQDPLKYYETNVLGTLKLLQACLQNQVNHFIFSSTAAVYGGNTTHNIKESSTTLPLHAYGHSKLMAEQIIKDVANTSALRYVILRYFNVAGADPSGLIGQRDSHSPHLIKIALQNACGLQKSMPIFGNDYPTPDGTCIRDFIHVSDVASAHVKALSYLNEGGGSKIFNCGYGNGFSVKEVIDAVKNICQSEINTYIAPRREGDVSRVVADSTQIQQDLNWQPQYHDLNFIIKTALAFEKQLLGLPVVIYRSPL
ncbi:MAG: UDP-glucose 4-epimerase GalE [Candidatus Berkiellales bacterium]